MLALNQAAQTDVLPICTSYTRYACKSEGKIWLINCEPAEEANGQFNELRTHANGPVALLPAYGLDQLRATDHRNGQDRNDSLGAAADRRLR